MDYTLKISGDFEKGDCERCPLFGLWGKDSDIFCDAEKWQCPLEEVRQGEWKPSIWGYPDRTSTCSICGFQYDATDYRTVDFKKNLYPICPNCGADMRGGKE